MISMVRRNVQQAYVSRVHLRTNGKEEVEKFWKMKSNEKRDNKEEKLTTRICISKERG